jgi:hypothetical protein
MQVRFDLIDQRDGRQIRQYTHGEDGSALRTFK